MVMNQNLIYIPETAKKYFVIAYRDFCDFVDFEKNIVDQSIVVDGKL